MTSPRADNDLFICWASFSLSPVTSERSTLSLPARSTRWRLPCKGMPVFKSFPRTWIVTTLSIRSKLKPHYTWIFIYGKKYFVISFKNLWERLLLSFRAVAPTALFFSPIFISSNTSAVDVTGCMPASGTANPLGWEVDIIPSVCKSRKQKLSQIQDLYMLHWNKWHKK